MKRFVLLLTVWALGLAGVLTAVVLPASSANAAGPTVGRLHGADRYATSAAIVHARYQPGVSVVYIATGVNFPDALAGGAAAAKAGGPLLVVRTDSIPTTIAAELTRLTPASIVVLGGTGAISNGVMTSLKTYTAGPVTRVAGSDRYATAAKLAGSFSAGSPVFIATGADFPDALAGAAAAAVRHAAILLTAPGALPPATSAALTALAPSSITILGGVGVVSAAVATQLHTFSSTVTRLWGADRYATAAAIATSVVPAATGIFIATGAGFADALTGGPVAGSAGQPLLLSTLNCLPAPTAAVIAADAPATVTLLGGLGVLGAGVESLTSCVASTVPTPVTTPVATPLGSVTSVGATPANTSIALSWTNPTGASLTGVMIRRANGATAPASATAGTLVTDTAKTATSYTDSGLTSGTQYSYALFAHDGTPVYAVAAKVTATTTGVALVQTWSPVTTVATGGTPNGLSCPTSTSCTAVDNSGNAVHYDGSAWAAPQLIDSHHILVGVSCPTTTFCTAVDSSGYALNDVGGHWSAPVAVNAATSTDGLGGVSCATNTFCFAFDNGSVWRYDGTSWLAPVNVDVDSVINSISCPSTTLCMAVDAAGRALSYDGNQWSTPSAVITSDGLGSVSCPTTKFCAATDQKGSATTWDGTGWSAMVLTPGSQGSQVACSSATSCLSVSGFGFWDGGSHFDGSTWTQTSALPWTQTSYRNSSASTLAACPVSSPCVAVGAGPTRLPTSSVYDEGTSSWSSPLVVEQDRTLVDASCASSTFCAAVDTAGNGYTFDGTNWSVGVSMDTAGIPTSISCAGGSFCMAVDDAGHAIKYSGGSWSPSADLLASIRTVSCASATFCMATIGNTVRDWNGTAWSSATTPGSPGNFIQSVSCTGTAICTSIDSSGYSLDDTPSGWANQQLVTPTPMVGGYPVNVSCVGAAFCAVEGYGADTGYVRSGSGSWTATVAQTGVSLGSMSESGHGLSCVAADYCLATGDFLKPSASFSSGMVATFDGSLWSVSKRFDDPTYAKPLRSTTVSCTLDRYCLVTLKERGNALTISSWDR